MSQAHDSAGRAGPRPRLGAKLVFSLLPLAGLLAAAEIGCRLFPSEAPVRTRSGFVVPDPDLIWRLDPAGRGPLAVNALGLRDDRWEIDADVQILLLGDSVSWGDQIADRAHVYPQVLQRVLNEGPRSGRHEVINASVPGYSTFQELGWLRLHGAALPVDALVLQFCLNDVTERYRALAEYGGDDLFLGVDTREGIAGLHGVLFRRSRAYARFSRFLQHRARRQDEYDVRKLASDSLSPELERAWTTTLAELDEVHRLSRERGLPLLVVVSPYRFQLDDPAGRGQPQHRLLAWGRETGVRVLDLLPSFVEDSAPRRLFLDANHLSKAGHRHVARVLAPEVEAMLATASAGD